MKENNLPEKTEIFLRKLHLTLPPPESFETVHNLMDTIKEYREYIHPVSSSWDKYIQDVFQILGFDTKSETKRLLSLSQMTVARSRRAVVALIRQDESFDDIVPGLEWSSFLYFVIHYFKVDWGILTDGQTIKIFNRNHNFKEVFLEINLEAILYDDNFDDFFAFYNVISLIRGGSLVTLERTTQKAKKRTGGYDLNYHLADKSNTVVTLFEVLHSKIKSISSEIEERSNKIYISYYSHSNFCQIQPQKHQIKIWVTRDIHHISDPRSLCRDVRKVGHHGPGVTEIVLHSFYELEDVFDIIHQAYKASILEAPHIHKKQSRQDRHKLRHQFWTELLEKANKKTPLHANISPSTQNWISAGAGISGLGYAYVVRTNDAQVELYIDKGDKSWNKQTFENFYQQKEEIERIFGDALDWQLLDDKRASRIRYLFYDSGLEDQHYWANLQDLLIDGMIHLHQAFQHLITQMQKLNEEKKLSHRITYSQFQRLSQPLSNAESKFDGDIPQKLWNVLMMYKEMVNGNKSYVEASIELSMRRGLYSKNTITDSCTRGLGVNTEEFKKLVSQPDQLKALLYERFPDYIEYISENIK